MNDKALRRKELYRKLCAFVQYTHTAVCVLSTLGVVVSFAVLLSSDLIGVAPNTSLFTAVIALNLLMYPLSKAFWKASQRWLERCTDERFGVRTYPMVRKSLKSIGIADPDLFLHHNVDNVNAYRKLKHVAVSALDTDEGRKLHRDSAEAISDSAHRIAMLLFPGEKELGRAPMLTNFIEQRCVTDYDELVGLLREAEESPMALRDGAL